MLRQILAVCLFAAEALIAPPASAQSTTGGQNLGAALYDERPNASGAAGSAGSATWALQDSHPSSTKREPEISGRIMIPQRGIKIDIRIFRDVSAPCPMTHVIQISLSEHSVAGDRFENIPGITVKPREDVRGVPLSGNLTASGGSFFIRLADPPEGTRDKNVALLKANDWWDIPIHFSDKHRGILAIQVDREVFDKAFAEWEWRELVMRRFDFAAEPDGHTGVKSIAQIFSAFSGDSCLIDTPYSLAYGKGGESAVNTNSFSLILSACR